MDLSTVKEKLATEKKIIKSDILFLLDYYRANSENRKEIYSLADTVRKKYAGDKIYIRGIIEFSNYCKRNCDYCGIRNKNFEVERYRLTDEEILEVCGLAEKNMIHTVVLQSGEDSFYTKEKFGTLLKKIKENNNIAVTVSAGERDFDTYKFWYDCGMDRYLIRFETANEKNFKEIHPDDDYKNRIECILNLKKIGVQTGSGFMIGLPGETDSDIADNILFCRGLDLDMIGVGPFIPHLSTPLGKFKLAYDIDFYTLIISLLRLANPDCHIPATTAFDAIAKDGRQLCLQRGANIFMPNITPKKYRKNYLLYPDKPCVDEGADDCLNCVKYRILSIGREIGIGKGDSLKNYRRCVK